LGLFYSTLWFFLTIIFGQGFRFSLESLPTFLLRAVIDIAAAHLGIVAITTADRSTYNFFRIATIPFLLVADVYLGYILSTSQWIGVGLVLSVLCIALASKSIKRTGAGLIVLVSVLASIAISLYKYNITHYNSVATEQFLSTGILLVYFYIEARKHHQNPWSFLIRWPFSIQSFAQGLATIAISFAYVFAPASIILTSDRAAAILLGIISGKIYFHERHVVFKLLIGALLIIGIYALLRG
jgi:hypothetical protein